MKNFKVLFFALTVIVIISGRGNAQTEEEMKNAMELALPNEVHEMMLSQLAGEYDYTVVMDFGTGPIEGSGTASNKSMLEGRFMEMYAKGDGMIPGWGSMEAFSVMGYDRRYEKYTIWGVDNMGTYSVSAEGDYDEAEKKYTLYGVVKDPVMKMESEFRFVIDVSEERGYVFAVQFKRPDGDWVETVTMEFTKKS